MKIKIKKLVKFGFRGINNSCCRAINKKRKFFLFAKRTDDKV